MWLILLPLAALAACVLAHVFLSRFVFGLSRPRAGLCSFVLGLGVLIVPALAMSGPLTAEVAARVMAWVLTYVCLSYCYIFGFFNVGESARRIRLLIELRAAGTRGLTLDEILAAYNARMVTEARLQRLLAARQVVERGGRYFVGRSDMLYVAKVLNIWKYIAFGPPSSPVADLRPSRSGR